MNENNELLTYIYQNAKMGVTSCTNLIKMLNGKDNKIKKIVEGQKCQLRSDMLRIYYHHHESKTIRQYEYENFVALYEAYKALKGNSFIDKIYGEVKTWEVIS